MSAMQSAADQISRHEQAVASLRPLLGAIEASAQRIVGCLRAGGKLLLCGNGGSAADAQHIAAELVGRYVAARGGLPAVALSLGVHTIGLLGGSGGKLLTCTDEALVVPTAETARVQECHILIGHIWCQAVDDAFAERSA